MIVLGILPGVDPEASSSEAVAINDADQIVGWSSALNSGRHAVIPA